MNERAKTIFAAIFVAASLLFCGTLLAAPACTDALSRRFLVPYERDLRAKVFPENAPDRVKFELCEDGGVQRLLVAHMKEDSKGRILLDPAGYPLLEGLPVAREKSEPAFARYEKQIRRFFDAKLKSRLPRGRNGTFNRVRRATVDRINAGGVGLENVNELQGLLGVEADGIVGEDTARAISAFNRAYAASGLPGNDAAATALLPALARDMDAARRAAEENRWTVPVPGSRPGARARRSRNLVEFLKAFKAAHEAVGLPERSSGRPTAVLREPQTISERIGRAVDDAVRPVGEFFDGLSRQIASMVPWVQGSVDTRGVHYGKNARMVGSGLHLPPTGLGYKSTTSQRWGTGRMIRLIQYTGAYAHQQGLPDLEIRDISKEGGGRLAWYSKREKRWIGHSSHRIGLDADIRNFFKPAGTVWRKKGSKRWREQVYAFDTERNWLVLRGILQYRVSDRRGSPVQFVFTSQSNRNKLLAYARKNDPSLYREASRVLNVEPNHGGHFHVRLYN